ncbi:unnamed protein product [Thlaspi arvense]|uniref:F-box domain-containing protein n=1 Tax=Thlaspi arvense TaxID=13288 RepID=A0AAU9RU00_THLAR|nr:unnamed protein product [Thlaspi arvense]
MKLRLRSIETNGTQKIEVPDSCSLQHLKDVVFQRLSSSFSTAPASVHLSLNRKDELVGSSTQESLQSLGITSGDLVFFTSNPNAFVPNSPIGQSSCNPEETKSAQPQNLRELVTLEPTLEEERTLDQSLALGTQKEETLGFDSVKTEILDSESRKSDMKFEAEENPGTSGKVDMDVDDDVSMVEEGKSFSVPCFLRKVFRKEVGEGGGGDHKLLVIAVHAVLLESGFVGFDSISRMKVEGFHLPDEWPSRAFTLSLWYTLPEIVNGAETVVLKFQSLGKYVNVYGSLTEKGSKSYRVCLAEDQLVFFLNLLWANCESVDLMSEKNSSVKPEKEVFEFWKTVKDRLALPLLIDLCDKANLPPPPCFMRLPTDLKFKILESLPFVDVARMGCVSSELSYLASNDDLWKQKYLEHFGNAEYLQGGNNWKEKFAKCWETRKKRRVERKIVRRINFPVVPGTEPMPWLLIRDNPYPFIVPRIIGGDYDVGPGFGQSVPAVPRRNVTPHRNLGGRRI